jgi:DNA mismatch endonuclease (patch repair protein)
VKTVSRSIEDERPERLIFIAPGVGVPYPEPTSKAASNVGRGNRRADTRPEIALRSALYARGLRFRKDYLLRCEGLRVRPDVVFQRPRIAVFVDGCFWHSCPEHGTRPARNTSYWLPKLSANVARDRRVNEALTAAGWTVVRIWEHEEADAAAATIAQLIAAPMQESNA